MNRIHLADEAATLAFAASVARRLPLQGYVALSGDLGSGKTTFARGFLRALGYQGPVPSPTYTLLEVYELEGRTIAHADLYRLCDGAEVEELGLVDIMDSSTLLFVEWPEHGGELLGAPDVTLRFVDASAGGRDVHLSGHWSQLLMDDFESSA